MKKLNNKGFAISALIYSILIMAVLIMGLLYSTLVFRKKSTSDFTHNVEKDLTNREITGYTICKRAETLHKVDGTDIGRIQNSDTLKPGDAFDCDVTATNNYKPETYRFYYLSRENGDPASQNIVLLYYKKSWAGYSSEIAYDNRTSPSQILPTGTLTELPTQDIWKNTLLVAPGDTNNKVDIKDHNNHKVGEFTYVDTLGKIAAARLPRYSEIKSALEATGTSIDTFKTTALTDKKYNFLFEDTKYFGESYNSKGYWLETVSGTNKAWAINANDKKLIEVTIGTEEENKYDVKPVIVININNIYWE